MWWVAILYFAEGFPYGVFLEVWSVYFRSHGVSLKEIGLMALLGMPWTLKPLWAPLVDRYGDRRTWIAVCLLVMAALLALHPLFDASHPSTVFWGVLLLFTVASATQDIAIDAHTIAILPKEEVGAANGIRVAAYRVAMIASGGGIVIGAGILWWPRMWFASGALLALLALPKRSFGARSAGASSSRSPTGSRSPAPRRQWRSSSSTSSAIRPSRP